MKRFVVYQKSFLIKKSVPRAVLTRGGWVSPESVEADLEDEAEYDLDEERPEDDEGQPPQSLKERDLKGASSTRWLIPMQNIRIPKRRR